MSSNKHIGALDQLDKSDADTLSLIRSAARILKISLNAGSCHDQSPKVDTSERGFAFREQWVLKWLIRRFNIEVQSLQPVLDQSRISFLQTHEAWQVLHHLLTVIPPTVVSDILAERKFMPCLDKSLQWLLTWSTGSRKLDVERASSLEVSSEVTLMEEEGRANKKRKLSAEALSQPSKAGPTEAVFVLALHVVRRCSRLLTTPNNPDDFMLHSGIVDWASSAGECASVLGTSLRLLLHLVSECPDFSALQRLSPSIPDLLLLWTTRNDQNIAGTSVEDMKVFNQHCLGPILALSQVAAQWPNTSDQAIKVFMRPLEKQLALHTVLPLRKHFNEKHAKSWKARQHALTWPTIKTVYDDFSRMLSPDWPKPEAGVLNMISPEWSPQCALIFTTATRLIPKNDSRRKQWEQPWLDALLIILFYISCPRLSKLITLDDKSIGLLDPIYAEVLRDHSTSLQALLQTVSDQSLRSDVSVVSYLAKVVLSSTVVPYPWPAISKLINIEAEAFLPDKNLATTDLAVTHLNDTIQSEIIDSNSYHILIHNILLPLLRYCARSRSLNHFLDLWQRGIEEAMRVYSEAAAAPVNKPAVLVWLDEDLFEEAVTQIDRYAPPSLYQEMLSQTLNAVQELTGRSGTTLDIFARIALCDIALRSSRGSDRNFALEPLSELQAAISTALRRRSDYQKQRWRLWSLLRTMYEAADTILLPEDLFEISGPHLSPVFGSPDVAPSQRREILARFSLLALLAQRGNDIFVMAFKREVEVLQSLIPALLAETESQPTPPRGWDGRLLDLSSLYKLVCGCIGVLNSRSVLYSLVPALLGDLLRMDMLSAESAHHGKDNADSTVTLEDLVGEAVNCERLTRATRENPDLRKKLRLREQSVKVLAIQKPNEDKSNSVSKIDKTTKSLGEVDSCPVSSMAPVEKKLEDLAAVELQCTGERSYRAIELLAMRAKSVVDDLSGVETRNLLNMATQPVWRSKLGSSSSLLITAVLLRTAPTELSSNADLADYFADIASLQYRTSATDAQLLMLDLENSKLVLDVHPDIVNQSTIDILLSNLCQIVSRDASSTQGALSATQTSPDLIFDRVCAELGSILSRYRRRLSDRHHLLLPLLQQLLRCLFYPGARDFSTNGMPAHGSNPTAFLKSLPNWLRASDTPLSPSSATKLSRILSSICNPTVSAARSSMKRQKNELNDETKRVKAIAGQHLQYLVMTHARSTLDGEIVPDVKEKLMPGMYAVLDSLSRDVMRAMNAAMDPGSRAIFKTLYDDWTRYGKWDKT